MIRTKGGTKAARTPDGKGAGKKRPIAAAPSVNADSRQPSVAPGDCLRQRTPDDLAPVLWVPD